MTLHACRIVKAKHAENAFSGEGAKRSGGRWNSPGVAVIYLSQSASLAMMEMLVHLQSWELLRDHYVLFEVTFDQMLVTNLPSVPKSWRQSPPPPAVQQVGDAWVAARSSAILQVPSVIAPESNYLLNPSHPDFSTIKIGPPRAVEFDPRLIKVSESQP